MILKKILTMTILLSLLVASYAFTIDCYAQLTLDINSAQEQFDRDMEVCDNSALFGWICDYEANTAFDFNINNALETFDKCCCLNGKTCCDP